MLIKWGQAAYSRQQTFTLANRRKALQWSASIHKTKPRLEKFRVTSAASTIRTHQAQVVFRRFSSPAKAFTRRKPRVWSNAWVLECLDSLRMKVWDAFLSQTKVLQRRRHPSGSLPSDFALACLLAPLKRMSEIDTNSTIIRYKNLLHRLIPKVLSEFTPTKNYVAH